MKPNRFGFLLRGDVLSAEAQRAKEGFVVLAEKRNRFGFLLRGAIYSFVRVNGRFSLPGLTFFMEYSCAKHLINESKLQGHEKISLHISRYGNLPFVYCLPGNPG
jgi:hypothetical protein